MTKYPWVSLAILGIWGGSATIIASRDNSDPVIMLLLTAATTAFIAIFGYRSGK